MTVLFDQNLRAVRAIDSALGLFSQLGYDIANAKYVDPEGFGLTGTGQRIRSSAKRREGYGLLVAEVDDIPRSLRRFGRLLVEVLHDSPLAIIGVRGTSGWSEWHIVRPKLVPGGAGAVSIARLTVDPRRPTRHDLDVIRNLAWDPSKTDAKNREAIDRALDVERVTSQFFKGLNAHYTCLVDELRQLAKTNTAVHAGLARVDAHEGAERVALRILTQTLFCYFLQRKGLLDGKPDWLSRAYTTAITENRQFYPEVMEPLFYEWLSRPHNQRIEPLGPVIPFLNGGLFDRQYGTLSLPLSNKTFSTETGLLGFLNGYSFTVSEDSADETEVAVDPEMLGKVFEALMSEEAKEAEGAVYTPRPVVQFMCREALVPWLQREASLSETAARKLLSHDTPFEDIMADSGPAEASRIAAQVDQALQDIRVLDPAVGSGAFLLGMLTELLRLRRLCFEAVSGHDLPAAALDGWKLAAIERNLFGVDRNATAVELCRLRLWLSLLVDATNENIQPLPNLDYRVVAADSLSDFLGTSEVRRSERRAYVPATGVPFALDLPDPSAVVAKREQLFETSDPARKAELRRELAAIENDVLAKAFERARKDTDRLRLSKRKPDRALAEQVDKGLQVLEADFEGRDRVYPIFLPEFHAPDVAERGGWDVVIMNPPYLERKKVAQKLDEARLAALNSHYGRTFDLMVHFGFRALELVREGGSVSMIFNDSIFTSTDAEALRLRLLDAHVNIDAHVVSRTKCFEGVAVNGGVIVASVGTHIDDDVRWVENYARDVNDLLGASTDDRGSTTPLLVGTSEVFDVDVSAFRRLPHRPLFRPSAAADHLSSLFTRTAGWDVLGRTGISDKAKKDGQADWAMLSDTGRLNKFKDSAAGRNMVSKLRPGEDFVLLGLVSASGQGIATADDRRFLGVIAGTREADNVQPHQERLVRLLDGHTEGGKLYEAARSSGRSVEDALQAVIERFTANQLGWPKTGTVRLVDPSLVRRTPLSEEERLSGIDGPQHWLPFDKGDDSGPSRRGAAWTRENPFVIDWSRRSVATLRQRAKQASATRKAYLRNEQLWGTPGAVSWNSIASYLHARVVSSGSIPSHGAMFLAPQAPWLSTPTVLALLNSDTIDFILRTFLVSRMNMDVGGIRRLPIPVLTPEAAATLNELGRQAMTASGALREGENGAADDLADAETKVNAAVRALYGIPHDEELWVVR